MLVQEPVQAAIWHCLNHYAYPDAIFLAERLCAEVESDETLFLLASCYYRAGKPNQAYAVLRGKGASCPQCRFLLAKCCMDLQKLSEAESVLTGGDILNSKALEKVVADFGEQAPFALQLLGKICSLTERGTCAAEAYSKALHLNPFLWQAFAELCHRGEKPDPQKTFQVQHLESFTMCHGSNPIIALVNSQSEETNTHSNSGGGAVSANVSCNTAFESSFHTVNSTPVQVVQCYSQVPRLTFTPDDSPLANPLPPSTTAKSSRLFSALSYGSLSPLTPSFGILPLESPVSSDSVSFMSPVQSSNMLLEANDQKVLVKRTSRPRTHVAHILNRKETPLQGKVFSQSGNTSHATQTTAPPPNSSLLAGHHGQNVRRSSRLFSSSNYSVKENNKSPSRNKFVTPKSPSRKTKTRNMSKASLSNKSSFNELNERNKSSNVMECEKTETISSTDSKANFNTSSASVNASQQALLLQKQSAEGLMALLREIGTAYQHLSQYNCRKAIECLEALPPQHFNTGWVLSLMGKAYFELSDFGTSLRYFREVRDREPHRTQMMEIMSTVLWHLQREVELSALAQELVEQDRMSPAAWCAAGNCFSLQKEHDAAIKFFQRAVQVDPSFAYAYTLLGHEYVTTEELDRAMSTFRSAIRLDSRHYNAWYGIGTIYSKEEQYQLAEFHFKKALAIHPQSSILMCHIGVAQHALQKADKALQTLSAAVANDPKNPLCKFHRASIFFAAGRYAEALKELEELKEIVPKESLVYYLTGKVHKKLGNSHLSLMHFSWATDLDPKGANSQIKDAIDPAISRNLSQADTLDDSTQTHAEENYQSEESSVPAQDSSQEGGEYSVMQGGVESDESL
ncbi:Cell division cycle protein 27-like protein [Frankliniella fusca]|uniref:Cell division cycle protein 27 homolog n=1 Tax=Frankliniella fusca TaxID=407009 RepID=A0AAE1L793_9NEOP|nr:Cell division cycle protein 27-like protein [Frankliniella fusca]